MATGEDDMYKDIGEQAEAVAVSGAPEHEEGAAASAAAAAAAGGADSDSDDEEERSAKAAAAGVHVVEGSLCMSCGETGTTRLMPTRIPFFREIIICAFSCPECGFRSSEVMTSQTQERGCIFSLKVSSEAELQRQLLKSDKATVRVPSLDLEIPSTTMSGIFTTVEGVLTNVADDLAKDQVVRRAMDPESAGRIDAFIARVRQCLDADPAVLPFVLELDDPSGNSFLENPLAPARDPALSARFYRRTREQNEFCGLNPDAGVTVDDDASAEGAGSSGGADTSTLVGSSAVTSSTRDAAPGKAGATIASNATDRARATPLDVTLASQVESDVHKFNTPCSNCGGEAQTRMCLTNIPHFKEVILMALVCPHCGFKDVEIKGGGAVPERGTFHTLRVTPETAAEDMRRDVLKSDTAGVSIAELDLEMEPGSLGGMYTTVEGLLDTMRERIVAANPMAHAVGDSAADAAATPARFRAFLAAFESVCKGEIAFTLVMKDPMANSWVYSPWDDEDADKAASLAATAGFRGAHLGSALDTHAAAAAETADKPDSAAAAAGGDAKPTGVEASAAATGRDPRLTLEWYTRSKEEDGELGIADMDVASFPSGGPDGQHGKSRDDGDSPAAAE